MISRKLLTCLTHLNTAFYLLGNPLFVTICIRIFFIRLKCIVIIYDYYLKVKKILSKILLINILTFIITYLKSNYILFLFFITLKFQMSRIVR